MPFRIIVFPSAIVIGPADIPLVFAGIVMFSLMVLALVLIIDAVPKLGPPSDAEIDLYKELLWAWV